MIFWVRVIQNLYKSMKIYLKQEFIIQNLTNIGWNRKKRRFYFKINGYYCNIKFRRKAFELLHSTRDIKQVVCKCPSETVCKHIACALFAMADKPVIPGLMYAIQSNIFTLRQNGGFTINNVTFNASSIPNGFLPIDFFKNKSAVIYKWLFGDQCDNVAISILMFLNIIRSRSYIATNGKWTVWDHVDKKWFIPRTNIYISYLTDTIFVRSGTRIRQQNIGKFFRFLWLFFENRGNSTTHIAELCEISIHTKGKWAALIYLVCLIHFPLYYTYFVSIAK